jgi:uncharacterized protein (TIGR04255 family)
MTAQKYNSPPIVEAVIGVNFSRLLSNREVERLRARYSKRLPAMQNNNEISVSVGPSGVATTSPKLVSHTLRSADGLDFVIIGFSNWSSGRAAPYKGWDAMFDAAVERWTMLRKIASNQPANRIGTRFINRIDVPNEMLAGRQISEMLNVSFSHPHLDLSKPRELSFVLLFQHASSGASIRVACQSIPPALLNHSSILLDIDAFFATAEEYGDDEIWKSLDALHHAKNEVFEGVITDELRSIFI